MNMMQFEPITFRSGTLFQILIMEYVCVVVFIQILFLLTFGVSEDYFFLHQI